MPETGKNGRTAPVLVDERLIPGRFLVVSNRLPYNLNMVDGQLNQEAGIGGLVTALDPLLRHTGGTWIGWAGVQAAKLPETIQIAERTDSAPAYCLRPVSLTEEEIERFYLGYSNRCLWPLFHYFQEYCEFNEENWRVYKEVNQRFADAVISEYRDGDLVWVHDYHLLLVPRLVREAIPHARIAFFLHIPFPSSEVLEIEAHAGELIRGLLGADLIGFHTDGYAQNFLDAVSTLTDHRYARADMVVNVAGRRIRLGSFPISIDSARFSEMASQERTSRKVEEIRRYYRAEIIALGVDRLDYSKGILHRLRAIENMLDRHPDIQGKFTFVQLSAPSRTKVHAYQEMREKTELLVGRINGRFGGKGCIPIDYRYEKHSHETLVAYYRAADLALVTPLRDGMNLVAKEYVASRTNDSGALVLSRFTGAAGELGSALLVNPYNPETMAEEIYQAITMPAEDKRDRMRRLRETVRRNDIYWWLERYLRALD